MSDYISQKNLERLTKILPDPSHIFVKVMGEFGCARDIQIDVENDFDLGDFGVNPPKSIELTLENPTNALLKRVYGSIRNSYIYGDNLMMEFMSAHWEMRVKDKVMSSVTFSPRKIEIGYSGVVPATIDDVIKLAREKKIPHFIKGHEFG